MKRTMFFSMLCLVAILFLPLHLKADGSADQHGAERGTVCLKEFPVNPTLFKEHVKPFVSKIIEKHGLEEWKAVLLTNELHRHLGMWSIIGAKMGVRAMELLGAPFDELEVVSFAGYEPPFSCINDGIQVSTGASLGRGTISVAHNLHLPSAEFIYKGKRLTLKTKPEVGKIIGAIIKEYSDKYVFQSPRYFHELDEISVEWWLKFDRKQLFEEKM